MVYFVSQLDFGGTGFVLMTVVAVFGLATVVATVPALGERGVFADDGVAAFFAVGGADAVADGADAIGALALCAVAGWPLETTLGGAAVFSRTNPTR